jgi:hypothetical protein
MAVNRSGGGAMAFGFGAAPTATSYQTIAESRMQPARMVWVEIVARALLMVTMRRIDNAVRRLAARA